MATFFARTSVLCAMSLFCAGCSSIAESVLDTPSNISQDRVELHSGLWTQTLPAGDLNDTSITTISGEYLRYGASPLVLDLAYPKGGKTESSFAYQQVTSLANRFRDQGLENVSIRLSPVDPDSPAAGAVTIAYAVQTAHAPLSCGTMAGLDGRAPKEDPNYKFGCSIETMLARQIARPADLSGRTGLPGEGDAERQANVTTPYRIGEPNEPLGGESASGEE